MKNIYLICSLLFFVSGMTACYDDDSTLGTKAVPEIEIGELRDTAIVSYSGNTLKVIPNVVTDYPEETLSYAWYYYSGADNSNMEEGLKDGYRTRKISESRDLSYEVNLPSGTYTFILEVTSGVNNYVRMESMKVSVTTPFSGCFYVLKETADGNTDLDLLDAGRMNENILTEMTGAPMKGKPVNMNYIFNQSYLDNESLDYETTKAMYLFSEEDTRVFETENFSEIFNRNNLFYDGLQSGERPLTVFNALVMVLLTDKGFYFSQPGDLTPCSGRYGMPIGVGGSKHVQGMGMIMGMMSYVFWSEAEHHLYFTDFNGQGSTLLEYDLPEGVSESNLDCIASGMNMVGDNERVWFLTEDATTHNRYLIILEGGASEVTEVRRLDASLNLAQADIIAGNALSSTVIYAVKDNALWAYNLVTANEFEIPLPGIASGETISYVSNQYMNADQVNDQSSNFDDLTVATYNNGKYKLYIYNELSGGAPQKAVTPYEGTGRIQSVRFASPVSYGSFNFIMPFHSQPIVPLTD